MVAISSCLGPVSITCRGFLSISRLTFISGRKLVKRKVPKFTLGKVLLVGRFTKQQVYSSAGLLSDKKSVSNKIFSFKISASTN